MPKAGWTKLSAGEREAIASHYTHHLYSAKGTLDMPALARQLNRSIASIGRAAKGMGLTNRRRLPSNRISARWVIDLATGCWLWCLATTKAGYAEENYTHGVRLVHRKHYEEKFGPVPHGLVLDHLCHVRHCVNPDHLEAVTDAVNVQRGVGTKLSSEQVQKIRQRRTESTTALAVEFAVTRQHIRAIQRGETWRNLL